MKNAIKIIVLVAVLIALVVSIVFMKKNRKDEFDMNDLSEYLNAQYEEGDIEDDSEDVLGIDDVDDEDLSGEVIE